jgi:hypothetical protein
VFLSNPHENPKSSKCAFLSICCKNSQKKVHFWCKKVCEKCNFSDAHFPGKKGGLFLRKKVKKNEKKNKIKKTRNEKKVKKM